MIRISTPDDLDPIYSVIAYGSLKYRGIIPADCWKAQYTPLKERISEISSGVLFRVDEKEQGIAGVMGLQEVRGVQPIRHAYVIHSRQGTGIGRKLLEST